METLATFRLMGKGGLTAAAVTERLGIRPTGAHEAGDRVSRQSTVVRRDSAWLLASAERIETGVELGEQLGRLLDRLEPHAADLWDLVGQGYWANWFCYVASHATEHAAELDRALLARLLALPGDLWLDITGDDVD